MFRISHLAYSIELYISITKYDCIEYCHCGFTGATLFPAIGDAVLRQFQFPTVVVSKAPWALSVVAGLTNLAV